MTESGSLERWIRPLTEAERSRLVGSAGEVEREAARAGRAAVVVGGVVVGGLWVATLLASDASPLVVTAFWLVAGMLLIGWVRRDLGPGRSDAGRHAALLSAAAERGEAEEIRVLAAALVELEEFEDEGACWGLLVGPRRMVFLCGQDFYETEACPTLDVTVVHPLGPDGAPVDAWVTWRGAKVAPSRVVDAERKWALNVPDHLDVVEAAVETLEEDLGPAPR